MTEEDARDQAAAIAREAMPILEDYAELLLGENARQNLIARSTEASIWSRHLLDSLQLARFARENDRRWLDVGSGPGLPGLVLAALGRWSLTLVEPRRRRAEFLTQASEHLGLTNVTVLHADAARIGGWYDLVSARAVGSVDRILDLTRGYSNEATRFVLPKGRSAQRDVDLARRGWHGLFHVEQSITDTEAGIVIADRVRAR